ncbi:MAG TPA: porin [Mariniflexile sp.]
MKKLLTVIAIAYYCSLKLSAQNNAILNDSLKKEWYQKISLRGYAQLRYNGLIQTNPDLTCEQCDKSWGGDGQFFFRRIRLVFYGQIHPRVYFYIQPDLASASGSNQHYGQIRDAYFDVGLDSKNEFRFRIGQSKVPFGFENLQSSQNRLALDRNDALNSAVRNERDLGVFFYWAPEKIRKRFSMLVKEGYKGSGDYGVFGFGVYNGQTANLEDLNNKKHVVARLTYPFQIGSQIIEPGIQAYTGMYTIDDKLISTGVQHREDNTYIDQRFAVTAILYPKPFGIQAEYNIGKGPEFDKVSNTIDIKSLHGGYLTLNAKLPINNQLIYPFAKFQYYNGGKKHELDARSYEVKELELGIEWLPYKNLELVAMYTFSDRKYEDFILQNNHQKGSLLRLQLQVNF